MVYSQTPPLHLPYISGESSNAGVKDRSLEKRELVISDLKFQLSRAQNRMKSQAEKHRSDRTFQVNDWVWLKLQPYRQSTVQKWENHKLAKKYYGPFQVENKVGKVAYKLKHPVDAQVHRVFHVSLLKQFYGTPPLLVSLPAWMNKSDKVFLEPQNVLQTRVVKVHNAVQVQYLVKWKHLSDHEATWEVAEQFLQRFPDFPIDTALVHCQQ